MEVLLCYVIAYLIEAFILWLYCSDLFIPKYNFRITSISLFLLYSLLFALSQFDSYLLNSSAFFVINLLFIYLFYTVKWSSALFHTGITTVAMFLGELVIFTPLPFFAKDFYTARSDIGLLTLFIFFSKLIYFFILYTFSHLFPMQKNRKGADSKVTFLLTFVPAISAYFIATLATVYHTTDVSASLNNMIAICSIFLLLLNLLIWFFFSLTQKRNEEFTELQLSLQRENDTAEYYKMLNSQNENRSILIHNIRNDLYTISNLAKQNQTPDIVDYIDKLVQNSNLQTSNSIKICKNTTLNAILYRYKEECKKQKIRFITDIQNDCLDFMAANELTALFCNLLDNAIEAASCVSDSFIEVNLFRQENAPYAILSVENSCPQNPFDSHGNLPSHKKDALPHGLGLKSVRRIVENYQGHMDLYYKEETQTFYMVARIAVS